MKLVFLPGTVPDLRWLKTYYISVFPEGRVKADKQFSAVQSLLKSNPNIGHPSQKLDGAREFHIPGTPFTFLYRIRPERIEVLRVLDGRADWDHNNE